MKKTIKIAFIIPKKDLGKGSSFYDLTFVSNFIFSKKYFSYLLAISSLASLTPSEYEISVFDENIETIDAALDVDIVGISVMTMFAPRAYEISDTFRARGIKTVLGGIHPSVCTNEALTHADAVVVGEAERVWGQLLRDFKESKLQRIYRAPDTADLTTPPVTTRKHFSMDRYLVDSVQTTRGCPFTCDFCSVYIFNGQKIRTKPIDFILQEIAEIQTYSTTFKKKSIFFADDNIIADKKHAKDLFISLKPYKINWTCQASINISKETELLNLMKDAGCGSVFIGFESIFSKNLKSMNKGINIKYEFLEAIQKIQAHGILVHSSFILGNDFDSKTSFDDLIHFIEKANLLMPMINILTPFPGTKLFQRLADEGRILHKNWSRYDTKHVVFKPKLISPEELKQGYLKVFQEIYSFENIFKKLEYYWKLDFWKHSNKINPISFKLRLLFALRLCSYLGFSNMKKTKFIIKILPKVFDRRVRVSTIITLMAYNDFAHTL